MTIVAPRVRSTIEEYVHLSSLNGSPFYVGFASTHLDVFPSSSNTAADEAPAPRRAVPDLEILTMLVGSCMAKCCSLPLLNRHGTASATARVPSCLRNNDMS